MLQTILDIVFVHMW